jgi:hypothetical protein
MVAQLLDEHEHMVVLHAGDEQQGEEAVAAVPGPDAEVSVWSRRGPSPQAGRALGLVGSIR